MEVQVWNEVDFFKGKNQWQTLLAESAANKLFMSWYWMSHWWRIWGEQAGDKISIYVLYDGAELIGLAPLYLSQAGYFRDRLVVKRLQFLGTRYGQSSGIRAEYLGFICKSGMEKEITETLMRHIVYRERWDELVLIDVIQGKELDSILNRSKRAWGVYRRVTAPDAYCYSVATAGEFEDYLQSLGKNTRLKLFNRRSLLTQLGNVECLTLDPVDGVELFDIINNFHRDRFNTEAFSDKDIDFITQVLIDLKQDGESSGMYIQLSSSVLTLDGKPLSAMFNIGYANKVYNIQLGFAENFNKKISLGTLHLGYEIESAFEKNDVFSFDLLAGEGKRSDYKKRLAKHHATLTSLQLIRNPIVKMLYRFNDYLLLRFKPNAIPFDS